MRLRNPRRNRTCIILQNSYNFGCQFNVSKLFKRGFRPKVFSTPHSNRSARSTVWKWVMVCSLHWCTLKLLLDEHSHIIASEEPVILTHAVDCQDPIACQEDWHSVWWNGMGRFLPAESTCTESEQAIPDPSHPLHPVPPFPCLQHRPVLRLQPLHTQPRPSRTLYNQRSRLA